MDHKLAMLLGLTGLLMVLMVDQADAVCCPADYKCTGWFFKTCKCRDGGNPDCRNGFRCACGRGTCTSGYGYDCKMAGACNVFACNCLGGCRGQWKRSVADPDQGHDADAELERVAEDARSLLELLRGEQENIYREENAKALREFGHHDANEDMKLSKEEALEMLKKISTVDISKLPADWFESMDKNNNGYIDPEEYDEDMAKGLE